MSARFPVEAAVRSDAADQPKPAVPQNWVCIFDRSGYWANLGGLTFEMPEQYLALAERVARMLNAAYEQGKEDAQRDVREALGLDEVLRS